VNTADITVLILTFDEAPNIARTVGALARFPEVVVVDSGSTDGTQAIALSFPNVRIVTRAFDAHASQWNFALAQCTRPWVLALDADYFVRPETVGEIAALQPGEAVAGYRACFRYRVLGRLLRGSLYPAATVLFRRESAHYEQDGHSQKVAVRGAVQALHGAIEHDDRKPLMRWLASQHAYAQLEADLLRSRPWPTLRIQDKLRRMTVIAPWLVPLYCLVIQRGLFDGWPGWYYALQRGIAEAILSLKLLEARSKGEGSR
jgi:glycosyltransferase involved in cell wall biosynthesis